MCIGRRDEMIEPSIIWDVTEVFPLRLVVVNELSLFNAVVQLAAQGSLVYQLVRAINILRTAYSHFAPQIMPILIV